MYKIALENSRLYNNENIAIINQDIMDAGLPALSGDLRVDQVELMQGVFKQLKRLLKHRFPESDETKYHVSYRFWDNVDKFPDYHVFRVALTEGKAMWLKRSSKTAFNYYFDRNSIVLFVSPRVYPMGVRTFLITSPNGQATDYLIRGNALIKRIWKERFPYDSKDVWGLHISVIKQSIKNCVETLYVDMHMFKNRPMDSLKPHEVAYISGKIIENLLCLMTLVGVNHNIQDYKLLNLERTKRSEYLELCYDKFQRDPYALDFTQSVMQFCGAWVDHMLKNDYGHLVSELRKK